MSPQSQYHRVFMCSRSTLPVILKKKDWEAMHAFIIWFKVIDWKLSEYWRCGSVVPERELGARSGHDTHEQESWSCCTTSPNLGSLDASGCKDYTTCWCDTPKVTSKKSLVRSMLVKYYCIIIASTHSSTIKTRWLCVFNVLTIKFKVIKSCYCHLNQYSWCHPATRHVTSVWWLSWVENQ